MKHDFLQLLFTLAATEPPLHILLTVIEEKLPFLRIEIEHVKEMNIYVESWLTGEMRHILKHEAKTNLIMICFGDIRIFFFIPVSKRY